LALVGPSIFQERTVVFAVVVKLLLSSLFKACYISGGDHHENRSVDVFDVPHLHPLSDWCSLHGRCLENITRIHISKGRISLLRGWIASGKTTGGWGWPDKSSLWTTRNTHAAPGTGLILPGCTSFAVHKHCNRRRRKYRADYFLIQDSTGYR
jgi:hypothetical protein